MFRFILGVVVGLVLGSAATAIAARMVGNDGPLIGWEVVKDGETICSDPMVSMVTKEIECD